MSAESPKTQKLFDRIVECLPKAVELNAGVIRSVGVRYAIQNAGKESWTQAIGRGALLAGFEGLLVPSASHRPGKNVVVFPDNLDRTSNMELISKEDLPPHPSAWPK